MRKNPVSRIAKVMAGTRHAGRLGGRELAADQKVMISLLDVETSAAVSNRQAAWATINRILDSATVTVPIKRPSCQSSSTLTPGVTA